MLGNLLLLSASAYALLSWPSSRVKTPVSADPILAVQNQAYIDVHGRERFFRGLNVVFKGFPYYPIMDRFDPALSFAKQDVELLSDLNMNIIRYSLLYAY